MVLLLVIVVASYRQTCFAYPNGGGAYTVSRDNLGEDASLVAATSLLIDYVLTVAVSVVAGVAAVTSAVPSLAPHAVGALDRVRRHPHHGQPARDQGVRPRLRDPDVRLRGRASTRCSLVAFVKIGFGDGITAESAHYEIRQTAETGGLLSVFLVLRAFASGCTALTGVEAVSNGIPAFQPPKSRNAAATLTIMGLLAITMFGGITALAIASHVHMAEDTVGADRLPRRYPAHRAQPDRARDVRRQRGCSSSSRASPPRSSCSPRTRPSTASRCCRRCSGGTAISPTSSPTAATGSCSRTGSSCWPVWPPLLIVAFNANVTRLIQLYILGVFLSFTLSQTGMVRHWAGELRGAAEPGERRAIRRKQLVNGTGAVATGLVFVIVLVTKFAAGAWIVVLAAPVIFLVMKAIAMHYRQVGEELRAPPAGVTLPARVHAVVLVSNLLAPTLRALAFAEATAPATIRAVKVAAEGDGDPLPAEWEERGVPVPLVVIESPYRETVRPVQLYVRQLRRDYPGDVISIIIPEYVVGHWWENLLHNQTALRLKARLLFEPWITVTSVPWVSGAEER